MEPASAASDAAAAWPVLLRLRLVSAAAAAAMAAATEPSAEMARDVRRASVRRIPK